MVSLRRKILIIDDEPRILRMYVSMINEASLEARPASNAHEALNILIREPIHLVLLDISIPGIDGRTIFEIIKEYDPNLKIIIASVYPLDTQRQMIPQAYDYFDKSHGPILLLSKVLNVLQEQIA